MPHVVFRALPVDVAQRKRLGVAIHRLLQADAQRQQVVHRLIGALQPVIGHSAQALNGGMNVFFGKRMQRAPVLDAVEALELRTQHLFQQHIGPFATARSQGLSRAQVLPAQVDQQLHRRYLAEKDFLGLETTRVGAHAACQKKQTL